MTKRNLFDELDVSWLFYISKPVYEIQSEQHTVITGEAK